MKLTKQEWKDHEEAMSLIAGKDPLNHETIIDFFEGFHPGALGDISSSASYFTPYQYAASIASVTQLSGKILDLAAGIGILSYAQLVHDLIYPTTETPLRKDRNSLNEIICVEVNYEYCEIGKRILPQATWVNASVFDQRAMQRVYDEHGPFDFVISNPPYGNVIDKRETEWMLTKGPRQIKAIEMALRMATGGAAMILPEDRRNTLEDNIAAAGKTIPGKLPKFPGLIVDHLSISCREYERQWKGLVLQKTIPVWINVEDVYGWTPGLGFKY